MKYRTIVADPPWEYHEGFSTGQYALPYPSMALEEIAALPVRELAAKDSRLFLWTTNRWLPMSFEVIEAWGFRYRQTLTWKKLDALSGSIAPDSEFLLVGARGAPGIKRRLPNAVIERSQTKTHSRKPDLFMDLIESVSDGPYLEMFSRRARLGWDTWGNESLGHVQMGDVA